MFRMTSSQLITIIAFTTLSALYLSQWLIAVLRVQRPERTPDAYYGDNITRDGMRVYDGGPTNNFWVFGILAIFLPVTLAFISQSLHDIVLTNTSPYDAGIVIPPALSNARSELYFEYAGDDQAIRIIDEYYRTAVNIYVDSMTRQPRLEASEAARPVADLCISIIVVMLTLEFSYIHNLRRVASGWISMLLAASTLDLATLLTIIFTVVTDGVSANDILFMGVTTSLALISTFYILAYARVSGALAEHQVDFNEMTRIMHERKKRERERNDRKVRKERERSDRRARKEKEAETKGARGTRHGLMARLFRSPSSGL